MLSNYLALLVFQITICKDLVLCINGFCNSFYSITTNKRAHRLRLIYQQNLYKTAFYEEMSSTILLQDYMTWKSVQTASHQLCNTKFYILGLTNKIGHFLSYMYIIGIQLWHSTSLYFSIRRKGYILQWYLWERSMVPTILLFRLLLKTFYYTSCSLSYNRKKSAVQWHQKGDQRKKWTI